MIESGSIVETLALNVALATVASLAAFAISRISKRPSVVHFVWMLVLARLLVPPVFELPVLPGFLRPEVLRKVASAGTPLHTILTVGAEPLVSPDGLGRIAEDRAGAMPRTMISGGAPLTTVAASLPETGPPAPRPMSPPAVLLLLIATGSFVIASAAVRRQRRLARLLELATPPSPPMRLTADRLAAEMGLPATPRIRVVPGRVSPMLASGRGGPTVVLPQELLPRLDPEELQTVLAHEFAHLRRRDHWVRRLELLATVFFWWAPVLWWARASLRRAEERCCDSCVVAVRPRLAGAYARALVETAAFLSGPREPMPLLSSGTGHVRFLEERVKMILRNPLTARITRAQRILLGLAAVLVLAVVPATVAPIAGEPIDPARDHEEFERVAESRMTEMLELEREALRLEETMADLDRRRESLAREIDSLQVRHERRAGLAELERLAASGHVDEARGLREDLERRERRIEAEDRMRALEQHAELRLSELEMPLRRLELERIEAERRDDPEAARRIESEIAELQSAMRALEFEARARNAGEMQNVLEAELAMLEAERAAAERDLSFDAARDAELAMFEARRMREEARDRERHIAQIRAEKARLQLESEGREQHLAEIEWTLEMVAAKILELEASGRTEEARELRDLLEAFE